MDDRRFDALVRSLALKRSRRSAVKALLGIGSIATVGAIVLNDVEAARRGQPATRPTPRPTVPPLPPTSTNPAPAQVPPSATASCAGVLCNGACCSGQCTSTGACCPAGSTVCGPDCCPVGQAECCDNACCYGACYGEELCCPTGRIACNGVCLPAGGCCTDGDCPGARCLQNVCVSSTPTDTPRPTSTSIRTATPTATRTEPATLTSTPTETATASNAPTETATPTGTATGASTADATETGTPTPTATPTPSLTAFLLDRIIECHVVVNLSGFPPNGLVTLSMVAFEDDIFAGFPSGNYYFEDIPVGPDGTLLYAMGPVWLDRDPFVEVTVQPFADSPATGQVWSLDPVPLPESCNPND